MANISYKVKSKYNLDSYENVVCAHDWIVRSCKTALSGKGSLVFNCVIGFGTENARYECKGIDDFKRYAFGKENIYISSLFIAVRLGEDPLEPMINVFGSGLRVARGEEQELSIDSEDELLIANLVAELKKDPESVSHAQESTIVQDNSIHIENSTIIKNSTIKDSTIVGGEKNTVSKLEKAKETFASKAFWQIVIPIAVSVIAGMILLIMEVSN